MGSVLGAGSAWLGHALTRIEGGRVKSWWFLSALVIAAACNRPSAPISGAAHGPTHTVALDRDFVLKVGESAKLSGTPFNVTFIKVAEDSRCLPNTTCVWAGNGKVALEVDDGRGEGESITLNTAVNPQAVEARSFFVRLVSLSPHAVGESGSQGYSSTLRLSRTSSNE
jgi:hypothetical protein